MNPVNITGQVRKLLRTADRRITGRIGVDKLFTDRCDHCDQPATVLIEATTLLLRGAEREGFIYCLDHARENSGATWFGYDEITVTVPASLIDATTPNLAA